MVWFVVGSALGASVQSVEAAVALGPPDRFALDPSCHCWRATWLGAEPATFELDPALGRALIVEPRADGQQDVALRLDEGVLPLLRAPCPIARSFVDGLLREVPLPREGTGAAATCAEPSAAVPTRVYTPVTTQPFTLASVVVSRRAATDSELAAELSPHRALFGQCFATYGVDTGSAVLRAKVDDGAFERIRTVHATGSTALDQCLIERLGMVTLPETAAPRKPSRVDVGIALGAAISP
ncbi:MAG: hypothetical protein ABMB14_18525 [Myxococcota bacterium]